MNEHPIRDDLQLFWPSPSLWILAIQDWQPGSKVGFMDQGRLIACLSNRPSTPWDLTSTSGPHLELRPEGNSIQCSSVGCSPFSRVKSINWCRKCCSTLQWNFSKDCPICTLQPWRKCALSSLTQCGKLLTATALSQLLAVNTELTLLWFL